MIGVFKNRKLVSLLISLSITHKKKLEGKEVTRRTCTNEKDGILF